MRHEADFLQALDDSLAAIVDEGLDVEQAVACFPDLANELRPLVALAAELRAQPAPPPPSPEFRSRLASQLARAPEPESLRRRASEVAAGRWLRLRRSILYLATGLAAVAVFLGVGAVQASASARPGDSMYWLKRRIEGLRLAIRSEDPVRLHLTYADRRLTEALAVPEFGGQLLADFSREVTAALVEADAALLAGKDRRMVVDPLLSWLRESRVRLVAARAELPPTAWRAALALVDEAIAALLAGEESSLYVPRLANARVLLAEWAGRGGWSTMADIAPISVRKPMPANADRGQLTAPELGSEALVAPRAVAARAGDVAAQVATAEASVVPPAPTLPPRPERPSVTPTPQVTEERPIELPHTPTQAPTSESTLSPTAAPTSIGEPLPTGTAGVEPTPSLPAGPVETASPVPSATPSPQAPAISYLACFPQTIEVYGQSRCEVTVANAEGLTLSYRWSTDWGVMYDADRPRAIFHAVLSMGGISKFDAPVRVTVRTETGLELSAETVVFVVPRLNQLRGPDSELPGDGRERRAQDARFGWPSERPGAQPVAPSRAAELRSARDARDDNG